MPAPKGNKYATGNKGGGRPSSFDPDVVLADTIDSYHPKIVPLVARCAALGMTEREIAEFLNVSPGALRRWSIAHEELSAALNPARDISDDRVQNAMFLNAVGYTIKTKKPVVVDKIVQMVEVEEYIKPSTTAQIFWLKNRRPDAWKDVQKHEHGAAGEFDNLTDEEIARRLANMVSQSAQQPDQEQPTAGISRKRGDKLN